MNALYFDLKPCVWVLPESRSWQNDPAKKTDSAGLDPVIWILLVILFLTT